MSLMQYTRLYSPTFSEAVMSPHRNMQQTATTEQALQATQLQHEAVLLDLACVADLCQQHHAEIAALDDHAS